MRADEYRRNAAECQRMAESTANEGDRRSWLRLAESWLRMIQRERPAETASATHRTDERGWTDAESFEAERRARGTRQQDSESAH